MASITSGTGATLKSATAEGQCLEALVFLQLQEASTSRNPSAFNNVDGAIDTDDMLFSGSFNIPASQTLGSSGSLIIAADPYLSGVIFTPGTGGTFKSVTAEAYVLETLMYLQALEQNSLKNPQNRNFITGSYNSDTKVYTGTFSLPISLTLGTDGAVTCVANPYLLD